MKVGTLQCSRNGTILSEGGAVGLAGLDGSMRVISGAPFQGCFESNSQSAFRMAAHTICAGKAGGWSRTDRKDDVLEVACQYFSTLEPLNMCLLKVLNACLPGGGAVDLQLQKNVREVHVNSMPKGAEAGTGAATTAEEGPDTDSAGAQPADTFAATAAEAPAADADDAAAAGGTIACR